jgi:hypothetical protein
MPPVQMSLLNASKVEEIAKFRYDMRHNIIDAAFLELGDMVEHWNIPSKEELFNPSVGNEVDWYPTETISLRPPQSIASFSEQKQSIILCKDAIDSYCDINHQ